LVVWRAASHTGQAAHTSPRDALVEAGSEWRGTFRYEPPNEDQAGDVRLVVEQRAGEAFQGIYATEGDRYIWRVAGSVREGVLRWEFVEVIREATPTGVVGSAFVEARCDGDTMEATFRHPLDRSVAHLQLKLQR
jgi:hypothetical protein